MTDKEILQGIDKLEDGIPFDEVRNGDKWLDIHELFSEIRERIDPWHYPSKGEYPTDREWYLGIFEEPDTGFRLAPVVCDYVGHQTKASTKEGWIIRCVEEPYEYYQNLKCVAWQKIRTDEVYLKCVAWKDRVPPKEEE